MSEIPDFDPNFPCSYCEQPVVELSVGGSAVCPWCDCGMFREGGLWDYKTMQDRFANFRRRMAGSVAFSQAGREAET